MESAFFEELAHARQQQSLQDPKRPYTKKEQEYYDFDTIEYLKEDPDAYLGLNTIFGLNVLFFFRNYYPSKLISQTPNRIKKCCES